MDCGRLIHGKDPKRLVASITLLDQRYDPRSFQDGLETIPTQACHMQQHVLHSIVRYDETKTFGNIEPFHDAGDFDQFNRIYCQILETGNAFR